jgi:GT2 family glycosyltransferase
MVNHNSTDCAIKSIESVYKSLNGMMANIIVVDNNSRDDPEILKITFPQIELILNKENLGFSKAVNQAIHISHAPFVVILNPDTVIFDTFFYNTIAFLKKNFNVGILGPRIYDADGKIQGSARKFPTPLTSLFGRKSPLTKIFPNNPISKKEFLCFKSNGKPIEVDWVSGACIIANRKAIEEVGGFDEKFFLYWEDTDLCKRIKDNGWKIVYNPTSHINHYVGYSSSQKPIFTTWHFHKSCFHLFKKHAKWPNTLLTPIAFTGLTLRAIVVMCLHIKTLFENHGINRTKKMKQKKR